MRAIDTNVVVRFLMADDEPQFGRARTALNAGDIFVSSTVLLETEWVLRSAYRVPRSVIIAHIRHLVGLQGMLVQEPARLALALDWAEQGMDFADALHLAGADGCTTFLSFDRKLAKLAEGRSPIPVEEP